MPDYSAIVAEGRVWAESRMLSTTRVRRPTGASTIDPDGNKVPVWEIALPDQVMRLDSRGSSGSSRTVEAAGVEVELATNEAHFPVGTLIRDGDHIEIFAGENAGTVWRVIDSAGADQKTALRVSVIATTRPEEWV